MRKRTKTVALGRIPTLTAIAVLLAGCAVTTEHEAPSAPNQQVMQQITEQVSLNGEQAEAAAQWWHAYGDAQLNRLVEQALANNHDLEAAALRLEAGMERLRVSRDQLRPQGGVAGNVSLTRQQDPQSLNVVRQESATLGLAADWQLDLFGRIRARVRQAQANLEHRQAFEAQTMADVVSGVVATYTRLMGAEEQLALLDKQLTLLDEGVDVLTLRVEEGLSTPLELSRAQALRYEYRARRPELEVLRTQYQDAMAILTGITLPEVREQVSAAGLPALASLQLQIHEPEQALRQSPEIRLAEARVAEAVALSDEAKAALFPSISVSGVLGWMSSTSLGLGGADENLGIRPQLNWSLLNLSALKDGLDAQKLEERAVLAEFEQTWLRVLNRADRSVQDWQAQQQQMLALTRRQEYARSAYEQAESRYEEGMIPYLDFLDAQRDLLTSEAGVIDANSRLLEAFSELQRAFPGHWINLL
ncbi:efflux transporter outer membrane subunit [Oceanimonas doudoroffii]|nr:TolC family protein [Oceanimonas doudoroffii]